jgi:hypothetical protein
LRCASTFERAVAIEVEHFHFDPRLTLEIERLRRAVCR